MTPNNTIHSKSNLDRFLAANGLSDYDSLIRRSDADPDWFWNAVITHFRPVFEALPNGIQDHNTPVEHRAWLPAGKLNIAETCLRTDHGDFASSKPALVWEIERSCPSSWRYSQRY
ncbi:acetyl-coenzyme A synthetase N-terminal domain-containing protein [Cribrihabitans sp. XS_ASV171]